MKTLEALAAVDDLKDFRLKDLMKGLGLDPKKPVLFYRELIKEARDVTGQLHDLQAGLGKEAANAGQRQQELVAERKKVKWMEASAARAVEESSMAKKKASGLEQELGVARQHAGALSAKVSELSLDQERLTMARSLMLPLSWIVGRVFSGEPCVDIRDLGGGSAEYHVKKDLVHIVITRAADGQQHIRLEPPKDYLLVGESVEGYTTRILKEGAGKLRWDWSAGLTPVQVGSSPA